MPTLLVDHFLEAKLHWPPRRDDWVPRQRVLDQLDRAVRQPVTLVAAPAGYGKTICMAQWLGGEQHPPAAWVSLDSGDNDPNRLWTHVAAALTRAGCVLPARESMRSVGVGGDTPGALLPAIIHALSAMEEDVVLVLDDFHFIREPACHDQVEFLLDRLPAQAHLMIVTRADPGLRLGRLRASGGLAEIRADDLSFTEHEAAALLTGVGVHLSPASVTSLVERTEGWPAGLYLATLSLTGRDDPDAFVRSFSGGNRFVGDYLTEEVLGRRTEEERSFITTISILDRFSGPVCDHLAGVTGSAGLLRDLERSNLFLVPLDENRTWFRFHHLFAAVARSELEMARADDLPRLHTRAADWFRDHGHIDEAVLHFLAAGDAGSAARLVQTHWLRYVDAGRIATVLGWLETIEAHGPRTDPAARVTAAWMAAVTGNEKGFDDQAGQLTESLDVGPLPDGSRSVESALNMMRGLFGYRGPLDMWECAQRAVQLETDSHSPFYAIANVAFGHAAYVLGDLDQAIALLTRSSLNDRAPAIIRALSLSTESMVEAERGDADRSREAAERAMQVVEANGLRAMPQISMAYLALGHAQAAAGKLDDAIATMERGLEIRRGTSAHGPWGMIHHLLWMARVTIQAGRLSLGRELLNELDHRLSPYSDGMDAMRARVADVEHLLRAKEAPEAFGEPLTGRELDVLRMLQGSMSLQQIAGELYLSFNTVKTHARAVYRKLGVHTRADAVRLGRLQRLI